jgi:hypothetical protein
MRAEVARRAAVGRAALRAAAAREWTEGRQEPLGAPGRVAGRARALRTGEVRGEVRAGRDQTGARDREGAEEGRIHRRAGRRAGQVWIRVEPGRVQRVRGMDRNRGSCRRDR